jgi:hypothetical protein
LISSKPFDEAFWILISNNLVWVSSLRFPMVLFKVGYISTRNAWIRVLTLASLPSLNYSLYLWSTYIICEFNCFSTFLSHPSNDFKLLGMFFRYSSTLSLNWSFYFCFHSVIFYSCIFNTRFWYLQRKGNLLIVDHVRSILSIISARFLPTEITLLRAVSLFMISKHKLLVVL